MFYLVTILDSRIPQENPVKPRTVVVPSFDVSTFLASVIDADHYCMIGSVESTMNEQPDDDAVMSVI